MVTCKDYQEEIVKAAKSVMIELTHILGEYRDKIIIVGGWVPELLFPEATPHHIGSMDVDLALNHRELTEAGYKTIKDLLESHGYYQKEGAQPFIYFRKVPTKDDEIEIQLDLLSGEYEGTGKSHRTQKIQELKARKARGCDLAFESPTEISVDGKMPGGAMNAINIRVASIVSFLVMKGMAMDDRLKEKDPYDIYYCLENYPDGLDALAGLFDKYLNNKLVIEGLEKIAKHFQSTSHLGPRGVTDFMGINDPEERELLERDVFERVNYLLEKLGFSKKFNVFTMFGNGQFFKMLTFF